MNFHHLIIFQFFNKCGLYQIWFELHSLRSALYLHSQMSMSFCLFFRNVSSDDFISLCTWWTDGKDHSCHVFLCLRFDVQCVQMWARRSSVNVCKNQTCISRWCCPLNGGGCVCFKADCTGQWDGRGLRAGLVWAHRACEYSGWVLGWMGRVCAQCQVALGLLWLFLGL